MCCVLVWEGKTIIGNRSFVQTIIVLLQKLLKVPILKIKTSKLEINVYIHLTTIFIFRIFKLFSHLDTFHTKQLTVSGVLLYNCQLWV